MVAFGHIGDVQYCPMLQGLSNYQIIGMPNVIGHWILPIKVYPILSKKPNTSRHRALLWFWAWHDWAWHFPRINQFFCTSHYIIQTNKLVFSWIVSIQTYSVIWCHLKYLRITFRYWSFLLMQFLYVCFVCFLERLVVGAPSSLEWFIQVVPTRLLNILF
jgi:hypothetical protein